MVVWKQDWKKTIYVTPCHFYSIPVFPHLQNSVLHKHWEYFKYLKALFKQDLSKYTLSNSLSKFMKMTISFRYYVPQISKSNPTVTFMVQNVRYSNGPLSQVTLPFVYGHPYCPEFRWIRYSDGFCINNLYFYQFFFWDLWRHVFNLTLDSKLCRHCSFSFDIDVWLGNITNLLIKLFNISEQQVFF